MISTGDCSPLLNVVPATDLLLPRAFFLTFSPLPVPWKSICKSEVTLNPFLYTQSKQPNKTQQPKPSGKGLHVACEKTELSNTNYQLGYLTSFLPPSKLINKADKQACQPVKASRRQEQARGMVQINLHYITSPERPEGTTEHFHLSCMPLLRVIPNRIKRRSSQQPPPA